MWGIPPSHVPVYTTWSLLVRDLCMFTMCALECCFMRSAHDHVRQRMALHGLALPPRDLRMAFRDLELRRRTMTPRGVQGPCFVVSFKRASMSSMNSDTEAPQSMPVPARVPVCVPSCLPSFAPAGEGRNVTFLCITAGEDLNSQPLLSLLYQLTLHDLTSRTVAQSRIKVAQYQTHRQDELALAVISELKSKRIQALPN